MASELRELSRTAWMQSHTVKVTQKMLRRCFEESATQLIKSVKYWCWDGVVCIPTMGAWQQRLRIGLRGQDGKILFCFIFLVGENRFWGVRMFM